VNPGTGVWPNLLAAVAVAILLPGVVGKSPFPEKHRAGSGPAPARFHTGKQKAEGPVDPACAGNGCHAPSPHRKGEAAAFLNMHGESVSCRACHGKEHEGRWSVSPGGPDRVERLSYSQEERTARKHDGIGTPASCERCHSEGGKERIAAAGRKEFPPGFVSPIPMRMMRERGRRWVPEDVR